jgi:hypothetical protein
LLLLPQIRRGVLGFELEQLPPDMAEAAGLPQQQQHDGAAAAGGDADEHDLARQLHSLRSGGAGGLGDRQRYKEAADKLRNKLTAVRAHHNGKVSGEMRFCTSSVANELNPRQHVTAVEWKGSIMWM